MSPRGGNADSRVAERRRRFRGIVAGATRQVSRHDRRVSTPGSLEAPYAAALAASCDVPKTPARQNGPALATAGASV